MATTTKVIPLINTGETVSLTTHTHTGYQNTLVSGTNIKTVNNESVLGTGNISVTTGGTAGANAITYGTKADGLSTAFLRSDAVLAIVDTTAPQAMSHELAVSTGSSNLASRADHRHAVTIVDSTTPQTMSHVLAASGGSSTLASRADHRHAVTIVDSSTPSTQAFGDSASCGSSTLASRADHKHAMPEAPTPAQSYTLTTEVGLQNNTTNWFCVATLTANSVAYTGGTFEIEVLGSNQSYYRIVVGAYLNSTPTAWDSGSCYCHIFAPTGVKGSEDFTVIVNYSTKTAKLYFKHGDTGTAWMQRYIKSICGFYNSGVLTTTRDAAGSASLPASDFTITSVVYTT